MLYKYGKFRYATCAFQGVIFANSIRTKTYEKVFEDTKGANKIV